MGELVLDKLIQKVSNMLEEIADVNILIRRQTPTQETLNRINERVDAVFGSLKQLEKGVQLDENKLAQLEEQTALLKEGLAGIRKMAEDLVNSFVGISSELKASVQELEVKVDQLGELVKELCKKSDTIDKLLGKMDMEEYRRWENNGKVLVELQKRLANLKVIGIILLVLVGMVLSFVLFR